MKKIILAVISLFAIVGAFVLWQTIGPTIKAPKDGYFFVHTGDDVKVLKDNLLKKGIVKNAFFLHRMSGALRFQKAKAGRYKIEKGTSLLSLLRMLRNGQQSPVKFAITKLRTPEKLAARIAKYFELDSAIAIKFLNNQDSLALFQVDSISVMALVMPLTYEANWNSDMRTIYGQFKKAYDVFWDEDRKGKAANVGLTPLQIVTLASIIDEETNAASDRPNVASVYLNRLKSGMPLQADPTVKFALKDFGLRRILFTHLRYESPYNTYLHTGLPPGPICTPQPNTIDAVLNAPKTEYLYFVANSTFDGTHIFTTNYADHMKYARLFQTALDMRKIK